MRTFEEIEEDIRKAISVGNGEALRTLATEVQAIGTPSAEATAFFTLGMASRLARDFTSALEQCRQALDMFEELRDRVRVARATSNIALCTTYR